MTKKQKTLKSLLIALAPNIVGMGVYQIFVSEAPIQGGLLIGLGLLAAVGYEVLQAKQIELSLPASVTVDVVENAVVQATEKVAGDIKTEIDQAQPPESTKKTDDTSSK